MSQTAGSMRRRKLGLSLRLAKKPAKDDAGDGLRFSVDAGSSHPPADDDAEQPATMPTAAPVPPTMALSTHAPATPAGAVAGGERMFVRHLTHQRSRSLNASLADLPGAKDGAADPATKQPLAGDDASAAADGVNVALGYGTLTTSYLAKFRRSTDTLSGVADGTDPAADGSAGAAGGNTRKWYQEMQNRSSMIQQMNDARKQALQSAKQKMQTGNADGEMAAGGGGAGGSDDAGAASLASSPEDQDSSREKSSLWSTFKLSRKSNAAGGAGDALDEDAISAAISAPRKESRDGEQGNSSTLPPKARIGFKKFLMGGSVKGKPEGLDSYDSTTDGSNDSFVESEGSSSAVAAGESAGGSPGTVKVGSIASIQAPVPFSRPKWWEGVVPGDDEEKKRFVESLSKNERQRQEISYELLTTEEDYVNDITFILETFMKPMKEREILKEKYIKALFSNMDELLAVNKALLSDLKAKREKEGPLMGGIGEVFVVMADYMKMYTVYCSNQSYALEILLRKSKNEKFGNFLKETMVKCKGMPLDSYLIKPVQRICKYPLLIRELIKNTDENHKDFKGLEIAKGKIESLVEVANERTREVEAIQKTLHVIRRITYQDKNLFESHRRFLYEGSFKQLQGSQTVERRLLFLFNDVLVVAKPPPVLRDKCQGISMYQTVEIEYSDIPDNEDVQNVFSITVPDGRAKERLYFSANTIEEKTKWIAELEKAGIKAAVGLQISKQEEALFRLLTQSASATGAASTVDPLRQYAQEQEANFRRQREDSRKSITMDQKPLPLPPGSHASMARSRSRSMDEEVGKERDEVPELPRLPGDLAQHIRSLSAPSPDVQTLASSVGSSSSLGIRAESSTLVSPTQLLPENNPMMSPTPSPVKQKPAVPPRTPSRRETMSMASPPVLSPIPIPSKEHAPKPTVNAKITVSDADKVGSQPLQSSLSPRPADGLQTQPATVSAKSPIPPPSPVRSAPAPLPSGQAPVSSAGAGGGRESSVSAPSIPQRSVSQGAGALAPMKGNPSAQAGNKSSSQAKGPEKVVVNILSFRKLAASYVYTLEVVMNLPDFADKWNVYKTYKEFRQFHALVERSFAVPQAAPLPELPGPAPEDDSAAKELIDKLSQYMTRLVGHPSALASARCWDQFLDFLEFPSSDQPQQPQQPQQPVQQQTPPGPVQKQAPVSAVKGVRPPPWQTS